VSILSSRNIALSPSDAANIAVTGHWMDAENLNDLT
jgi:hypothetical protein